MNNGLWIVYIFVIYNWLYIHIHKQFSLFHTNTNVLTGFMISLFFTAPTP